MNNKIIVNPQNSLQKNKANLSPDIIDEMELSKEQIRSTLLKVGIKAITKEVPVLGKLLEVTQTISQELREEKLKILLGQFKSHFDSMDQALGQLKMLFASRSGLILFQKVVQILDNGDFDQEWIDLLAKTLKNISDQDFENHFSERSYILAQINRLSPQALIILSKYKVWNQVDIQNTTTTSNQTMSGDWASQVTQFLKPKIGVTDLSTGGRINHSFQELESTNMIILSGHQLKLTAIGIEVQRVLE